MSFLINHKILLKAKHKIWLSYMITFLLFGTILIAVISLSSCEIPKVGVDIDKDGKDDVTIDIPNMWNKNNEQDRPRSRR